MRLDDTFRSPSLVGEAQSTDVDLADLI